MKVYILYQTDAWNSRESESVIAVCSTHQKAIEFADKDAIENGVQLSLNDLRLLEEIGQTQGRNTNYMIEPIEVDEYYL